MDTAALRELYRKILADVRAADYSTVGTDPAKYVERFPKAFRDALASGRQPCPCDVVLHRETFDEMQQHVQRIIQNAQQAAPNDPSGPVLPCGLLLANPAPQPIPGPTLNYPAKYYRRTRSEAADEFHVFGLNGLSWVKKTLYMLAQFGFSPECLTMADEGFDLDAQVRAAINQAADGIGNRCPNGLASVTICSIGAITTGLAARAKETDAYRDLKASMVIARFSKLLQAAIRDAEKFNPAQALKEISEVIGTLNPKATDEATKRTLNEAVAGAEQPPSAATVLRLGELCNGALKKSKAKPILATARAAAMADGLRAQRTRLAELHVPNRPWAEILTLAQQEQLFVTSELLQGALEEEPNPEEIAEHVFPRTTLPGPLAPTLLQVGGRCHMLISVTSVHGDICDPLVRSVLRRFPNAAVNFQGTCGSLTEAFPIGTIVSPTRIHNLDPNIVQPPSIQTNPVFLDPAGLGGGLVVIGEHANNCTMLQEHAQGIAAMGQAGLHTADMESYHVATAYNAVNGTGGLRILLQVADVASSKEHSQQAKKEREPDSVYAAKCAAIVKAFGLM